MSDLPIGIVGGGILGLLSTSVRMRCCPSPAATSSLAIAEYVVDRMDPL